MIYADALDLIRSRLCSTVSGLRDDLPLDMYYQELVYAISSSVKTGLHPYYRLTIYSMYDGARMMNVETSKTYIKRWSEWEG